MNGIEEYFIKKGKAENCFEKCGTINPQQKCSTCKRRHFSYPDRCNDGWPGLNSTWKDEQGSECVNYLENKIINP